METLTTNGSSSDDMELLLFKNKIFLEFQNIYYKPPSMKTCILKDVSGKFQSGHLTAILGPSGAGKTTLLNVLSGFKDNGLNGSILVNGVSRKVREFRKNSSYIPQHFAMLNKLTVSETLYISADLKLGLQIKSQVKDNIVSEIKKLLNLEKCSNTLVERLSGGEKKRLSIGVELVTNPPIMFFDEPTSGLDSVSSLQILTHLQKLAHSGRTVICVIHQPSSRLLRLFDDVYVLSEGECIYDGPLDKMLTSFESAGYICPNYYNPADYAIELASKEYGSDLDTLISIAKSKYLQDGSLDEIKTTESSKLLNGANTEDIKSNGKIDSHTYSYKIYPANYFEQYIIITKRSMRAMWRDILCVQLRVICHIVMAVLLGLVFWNIGDDASKVLSIASCIFFNLMFIFFANAMPAVLSCPLETEVFLREHLNNWYSVGAYYVAKITADLPLQFLCPTLFVSIAYFMTGQPNDLGRFLMFWGICLLNSVIGQSLGLFIGSAVNLNLAVFLVPASSIPMLIFSGFFIRFNELSDYLKPLTYVSYFRYSLEGSIQAIFGYNRTELTCSTDFCYYKSTEKFLKDMDMLGDRYGNDVIALIIWIIALQISFYISLIVKVKRAK